VAFFLEAEMKVNSDGIVVDPDVYWLEVTPEAPRNGQMVNVLNFDGCEAGKTIWGADSHKYFVGWHPLAKVPASIKAKILERYKLAEA
jgi:hypothetical protein